MGSDNFGIEPDLTEILPTEIINQIVGYLDAKSLLNVSEISQSWRELAVMEEHWKCAYLEKWKAFSVQSFPRTWMQTFRDRYTVEKALVSIENRKEASRSQNCTAQKNENETQSENSQVQNDSYENEPEVNVPRTPEYVPSDWVQSHKEEIEWYILFGDELKNRAENRINSSSTKEAEPPHPELEPLDENSEISKLSTEHMLQLAAEEYSSVLFLLNESKTLPKLSNEMVIANDTTFRLASASISHIEDLLARLVEADGNQSTKRVCGNFYLKYADVLAMLARLHNKDQQNLDLLKELFLVASANFDKASDLLCQYGAFMAENALRYSADCLVDLSRKLKPEKAPKLLKSACERYERSLVINPNYFMAYYYYGRALHFLANTKKGTLESDEYFFKAIKQFEDAKILKSDDVYLAYEHASVLQDFALSKLGEEAEELFKAASKKYEEAHLLSVEDSWILRNWADSLYDHAKLIFSQIEEEERNELKVMESSTDLTFIEISVNQIDRWGCWSEGGSGTRSQDLKNLVELACEKYEMAVKLNPNYSTAFNSWALALATRAKIGWDQTLSRNFFAEACKKFESAIRTRSENTNTETCNWSMTLISQAIKEAKFHLKSDGFAPTKTAILCTLQTHPLCRSILKDAKERLKKLAESNDTWSFFCMARYHAAKGNEDKCQVWLEKCSEDRYLRKATRWQLAYFDNVKEKEWFQAVLKESQNPIVKN